MTTPPIKVLATSASEPVATYLLYLLAKGDVFGPNQRVSLVLHDTKTKFKKIHGLALELMDCCFKLLVNVTPTSDTEFAVQDASYVLLFTFIDERGMHTYEHFQAFGRVLHTHGNPDVRVAVYGDEPHIHALICFKQARRLPRCNIVAVVRQAENKCKALVAMKLGVRMDDVLNVAMWGGENISDQYIDHQPIVVREGDGSLRQATLLAEEDDWFKCMFFEKLTDQISMKAMPEATAKATAETVKDWYFGIEQPAFISLGVYIAEKDMFFTQPVTLADGRWEIVPIAVEKYTIKHIERLYKRMERERDNVMWLLGKIENRKK